MKKYPNILIIDDEPMVHLILGELINSYGFTSLKASNAREAEEQIKQRTPDLILLDIHIPGSDSMELLQTFIQNPALKNTRVIIISGSNNYNTIGHYINAGADDYILKPFHATMLRTRLIHALERIEKQKQLDQMQLILSTCSDKLQKAVSDSTPFSEQVSHELNNVLLGVESIRSHLPQAEPDN